jgi:hypothetical protein
VRKANVPLVALLFLLTTPLWAQRSITYSTYLGGPNAQESINHITVDSAGNAYVTFEDYEDTGPSQDFVVGKISPAGATGYTTVLGTFHSEEGASAVTVDSAGNAYVTGWAYSYSKDHPRFPTLNALQPEPAGGVDAVLVKLDPNGKVLFSTYLGGSGDDYGRAIALDAAGNIYIAGTTSSPNFPTRSPYQARRVPGGQLGTDVFLTEIDATGSTILYSTYLGGDDDDSVASIAIDSAGNIYLAGSTRSSSFAGTVNLRKSVWNGYAVKFNPTGTSLTHSLAWSDPHQDHQVMGAALDRNGNFYVAEQSIVRKVNSGGDGFVFAKNIPAHVTALAVDQQGNAYAAGRTGNDLCVFKIPSDGSDPLFLTSLNGTEREHGGPRQAPGVSAGNAVAVTAAGKVYVGGYSESFNFPTTNGSTRSPSTAASTQDAILFILEPTP